MKPQPIPHTFLFQHPVHFFAIGFGSGLSPFAPGTMGTLVAIPLYYLVMSTMPEWGIYLVALLCVIVGIFICDIAAKHLKIHDHPGIVWDEIAGYFITMLAIPLSFQWIIVGFVLFRIFDIVKPWPIGLLDRHVHGGFGIMIDDVVAGIFANLVLHLIIYLT